MPTVKEIYDYINSLAEFDAQEQWDNSGLLLGDPEKQVEAVALALDATAKTAAAAKDMGAQLLITHHPVIFSPLKKITAGSVVYELISGGISAICAHTCLDSASGGVNDVLAAKLGLENPQPLPLDGTDTPMVRLAELKEALSGEELAGLVKGKLGCHLRLADAGKPIKTVALCGGSGGSLLYEIIGKADAFITGELSHHHFIDAADKGLTAIAAGHFETEQPVMPQLCEKLKNKFKNTRFTLIEQDNPVKYY